MIRVTVEIREGALARRMRITAPSIKQALKIAGERKPARRVHVLFPIDPEIFLWPDNPTQRKAA